MAAAKSEKRRPSAEGTTVSDLFRVPVLGLKADHRLNHSRAPLYDSPPELAPYIGPRCCFTLAEIEERLTCKGGLQELGQKQPIEVYITKLGATHVVTGYLRHAALLLAQLRGIEIPGLMSEQGVKVKCLQVSEPKSQADWMKLALGNAAENDVRKATTPVDKAFSLKALIDMTDDKGNSLTIAEAASLMSPPIGESMARRYLSLLELPPHTLREVHEGKLSMPAALAKKSAEGQGSATGPRAGLRRSALHRALTSTPAERPRPTGSLSAKQVEALLAAVIGDETKDEKVAEWLAWADAPKPERPAKTDTPEGEIKRSRKKAPPRAGKQAEENDA